MGGSESRRIIEPAYWINGDLRASRTAALGAWKLTTSALSRLITRTLAPSGSTLIDVRMSNFKFLFRRIFKILRNGEKEEKRTSRVRNR